MFEFFVLDESTLIGGALILLVLAFFRFGHGLVNLMMAFTSSPVETVERSITKQE